MAERITSVVSKFGQRRRWVVTIYDGDPQAEYEADRILWVERAEDEYGISPNGPFSIQSPFCVLYRDDWLRGEHV